MQNFSNSFHGYFCKIGQRGVIRDNPEIGRQFWCVQRATENVLVKHLNRSTKHEGTNSGVAFQPEKLFLTAFEHHF